MDALRTGFDPLHGPYGRGYMRALRSRYQTFPAAA